MCLLSFGQEALSIARTLGDRATEVVATTFLGITHTARGEFSDAATFFERNVALEGNLRSERFGAPFIQSALALAGELGMRPLVAHCHLGLGTLYIKTGRQEQARTELSTAMEMYRAMEMTFWLPETEAALAQVDAQ